MTNWGADIDEVLNTGIDLGSFGVQGWALPRAEALSAIARLQGIGVPIVGGDAFERVGDELKLAYANWCCAMRPDEDVAAYLARSATVAAEFVSAYTGADPYFAIVPSAVRLVR